MDRITPKWVYVVQYRWWWKLPLEEWVSICVEALVRPEGYEGYTLAQRYALKQRPRRVQELPSGMGLKTSYWIRNHDPDYVVVSPLDWEVEDFAWYLVHDLRIAPLGTMREDLEKVPAWHEASVRQLVLEGRTQ